MQKKYYCAERLRTSNNLTKQSGFTLIEILVTVTIGLLILNVLMEIYLTCMRSLRLQNGLYHIQNMAKDASFIFSSELKKAGNIGCAKLSHDFPITSYKQYALNTQNKIIGNAANRIMIRYAEYPNATLIQSMDDNTKLYASQTIHFSRGDILIISDCKRAEIFEATQVNVLHGKQEIISLSPLHDRYEKHAEISRLSINQFYVANTHRKDRDGTFIYSLYRENNHQGKSELIAGVNNMQVSYTINDSDQLKEMVATEVADWSKVKRVAVDLEMVAFGLKKIWHFYSGLQVP